MTETRTALVDLADSGIVIARVKENAEQSLVDARENLAAVVSEARGHRRPLLIDMRTARPLDADARHHYTGQALVEHFSALALLVEASPFGRMMGNVYLRIAKPGIPTQLFAAEADAVAWLHDHRP